MPSNAGLFRLVLYCERDATWPAHRLAIVSGISSQFSALQAASGKLLLNALAPGREDRASKPLPETY
jgi:hypothetical protein